jgi:nuclear pore complex protein Nup62
LFLKCLLTSIPTKNFSILCIFMFMACFISCSHLGKLFNTYNSCMYVCMYVCTYLCMCVYIYMCVCVCVFIYICITYVCTYVCMYLCTYVCMYICIYLVLRTTYVCMYVCIQSVQSTLYTCKDTSIPHHFNSFLQSHVTTLCCMANRDLKGPLNKWR